MPGQAEAQAATDPATSQAKALPGDVGLSLHLHCDTCGRDEAAPFEIGDKCICGGTFDTPGLTDGEEYDDETD